MGKVYDAYKRYEKAHDDFWEALQHVLEEALPDDVDVDATYLDASPHWTAGLDLDNFFEVFNALDDIAKDADSGKLAKELQKEYGDE